MNKPEIMKAVSAGMLHRARFESSYSGHVGSGDYQAMEHVLTESFEWLDMNPVEMQHVFSGALMTSALISIGVAFGIAESGIEFLTAAFENEDRPAEEEDERTIVLLETISGRFGIDVHDYI